MEAGDIFMTRYPFDAIRELKDKTVHSYESQNENNPYYRYDILRIWNESYTIDTGRRTKIESMPLGAAKPYAYYFIEEDVSKLKYTGQCVRDNMIGTYGSLIKHFEDKFDKYCNEIEENGDEKTSLQIKHVCEKLDIAMYAYDLSQKCFLKHVSKNRNYPSLVYYAINNHMYHVTDNEKVSSLIAQARKTQNHLSSTCLSTKEPKDCFTKGSPQKEDIPILELFKEAESVIVIYNKPNLNQELTDLMSNGTVPHIKRSNRNNITYMTIKNGKLQYHLFAERNDVSVKKKNRVSDIKTLCEQNEIDFKNQTLPSFVGGT